MARKVTAKQANRYEKLIESVFLSHFKKGLREFEFRREEIEEHASRLAVRLPKNIGDLIYSFRFRANLPDSVRRCAPSGHEWVIEGAGRSKYRFVASPRSKHIKPNSHLVEIKVPDSTPGIVSIYAMNDEQALLARIRYNRLIDTFTRTTCYSLQNHLRTTVPSMGQIETDELYVGVDRSGSQFVFPVQAKGGKDKLSTIQIRQDWTMCRSRFPTLVCRPIAAQFLPGNTICLFEFEVNEDSEQIAAEKHYRLVPPEEIDSDDLRRYALDRSD